MTDQTPAYKRVGRALRAHYVSSRHVKQFVGVGSDKQSSAAKNFFSIFYAVLSAQISIVAKRTFAVTAESSTSVTTPAN